MPAYNFLRRASVGPKPSQASHDAILDAGERLLSEAGTPAGFTIEAVAKRAQAGKPTVYRHWKNKEALFLALAKLRILSIDNRVPDRGSVAEELSEFHQKLWERLNRNPIKVIGRSLLAAALNDDGIRDEVREQFARDRRQALQEILKRAQKREELSRDLDIELAVDFLCGFTTYRFILGLPVDDSMIRQMVAMLLHGLLPPASALRGGRATRRRAAA